MDYGWRPVLAYVMTFQVLVFFAIQTVASEYGRSVACGLSAMSRLAPVRIAGLVMGVWFLALAVGNYLAGMASSSSFRAK